MKRLKQKLVRWITCAKIVWAAFHIVRSRHRIVDRLAKMPPDMALCALTRMRWWASQQEDSSARDTCYAFIVQCEHDYQRRNGEI